MQDLIIDFGNGFTLNLSKPRWQEQGLRAGVFGSVGSGKSYCLNVFLEELLHLNVSTLVIDPEGEYISLKELAPHQVVIVGHRGDLRHSEMELAFGHLDSGKMVIVNMNRLPDEAKLALYCEVVGQLVSRQQIKRERDKAEAVLLVVEEASLFAPKSRVKNDMALDLTVKVVQGRKHGIHACFVVQQPGILHPAVLSQFNMHMIGRLEDHIDFNAIKSILPFQFLNRANQMGKMTLAALMELETGEFFLRIGPDFHRLKKVRARQARDLSRTPALSVKPQKQLELIKPVSGC